MTLPDKAFIKFCSTCWAKGYARHDQTMLQEKFKSKFHLMTWSDLTREQMDEVMTHVKSLPKK